MNNIDILEDYIELIEKGYCEDCNELCNISTAPSYPSKAVAQAISTLITENKELKEEIKEINEEYNAEQKHEMENTIPKSKVEEIIHNNKPHIAQEKLQSLLEKE